jgi:hypothetical protein
VTAKWHFSFEISCYKHKAFSPLVRQTGRSRSRPSGLTFMKKQNVRKSKEESISVIVPRNPFVPPELQPKLPCLCALDVTKLMLWWPGTPHSPHRDAQKVRAIQRSLDWKRVAHIAAYLLQREIDDVPANSTNTSARSTSQKRTNLAVNGRLT